MLVEITRVTNGAVMRMSAIDPKLVSQTKKTVRLVAPELQFERYRILSARKTKSYWAVVIRRKCTKGLWLLTYWNGTWLGLDPVREDLKLRE